VAGADVDRDQVVRQAALLEHDGNLPAIRRRPVVEIDHERAPVGIRLDGTLVRFRRTPRTSLSGETTMAVTLYDLSVGCFLQTLGGVEGFLAKSADHFKEKGVDANEIVETRLFADMLPFRFQIVAV